MKLTAELSLYPLQEEYIAIIEAFIASAAAQPGVEVVTNAMSTQICGDYDPVFDLLRDAFRNSVERSGKQVLVCKLIPDELPISPG